MPVQVGYSINDITALRAIDTTELVTGYSRKVVSQLCWYMYVSNSTTTADNNNVVAPNSNVGRWFKNKANIGTSDIANLEEYIEDVVAGFIVQGSNVTISYNDSGNTLTISSATAAYTDEQAQDAVGNILTDSTQIDFTYNDAANTITAILRPNSISNTEIASNAGIAQSKISGLVENLIEKVNVSDLVESVQDIVGAFLVQGNNITLDYNDVSNTLSISGNASGGGLGSWDELYNSSVSSWDSEY